MSSARKRAAIQKANNEADWQRERAILAEHHANVMREFAEVAARKADALQAQLDALMLEYCPEEMSDAQKVNWARHQRPVSDEVQREIDLAVIRANVQIEAPSRPLAKVASNAGLGVAVPPAPTFGETT